MRKLIFYTLSIAVIFCLTCVSAKTPSNPDSYVYIISPANGEVVTNPVLVRFGLRGMGIAPAGAEIKGTGHHHLLIDVAEFPNSNAPIPADEKHRHFGKGQTEVLIELEPGEHSLQLLLADFSHIPHDPVVKSAPITIHVKE